MSTTAIAIVVAVLLAGGAGGSISFSRLIAKGGNRNVTLTAAVALWLILFGIIPFIAFAMMVRGASASPPTLWEDFVLNMIPFALVISPLAGFLQGLRLSRTK